ncbi:MAG: Ig-like domain-containing protein, partial [Bacteroidales bacterium]|nr:Ig-like domain-containing protein [Bacteroidales bacterium]
MKTTLRKTAACLVTAIVSLTFAQALDAAARTIVKVQEVKVDVVQGNAPSLPSQVMVTYSDGSKEYRSVRWTNSGRMTEELEASDSNPAGSEYNVKGFITGDNTTASGYPVSARVCVVAMRAPAPVVKAEPLPLGKVRITGDNRLTSNRDLDMRQILGWDVKQQLYNLRDTYGLSTDGYPQSDG